MFLAFFLPVELKLAPFESFSHLGILENRTFESAKKSPVGAQDIKQAVKHSGTPATHTTATDPSHRTGQRRDDMAETSTKYGLMRCLSKNLYIFAGRNIKTDAK